MKKVLSLILLLLTLWACKPKSQYITIDQPQDQMCLQVNPQNVVLVPQRINDVAATFSWTWPELQYGATSYEYFFKMDIADNQFQTSIPKMAISDNNQLTFTHKELNNMLEQWGATAGQPVQLEAELIANLKGTEKYIKPMISKLKFTITGYASVLYIMGSSTPAGNDFTKALQMDKLSGQDAYSWVGLLTEGEVSFVSAQNASAISYGKFPIKRIGCYQVIFNLTDNQMTTKEPLYLVGDATPGGWSLNAATPMNFEGSPIITWKGVLTQGEMKLACHPQSGLFEDPFYQAPYANAEPSGTQRVVLNPDGTGADNKWKITEDGVYGLSVNLDAGTITFERDHSMDDLPVKAVWVCGSATPSGWNTPFPEKMSYDFNAAKGTFVWEGTLTTGEIKFPLNSSQYEGAFYLADDFDTHITENTLYHINYFASTLDVPDKKWIIDTPGRYKIVINVLNNTVKFIKQ